MIVPGTDLASSRRAVDISKQFPDVCFAAIGIHPHHAQDLKLSEIDKLRHELEEMIVNNGPAFVPKNKELLRGKPASVLNNGGLRRGKIVAIGEVGLDYHVYQKTKYEKNLITDEIKMKQKELFLMQMSLGLIHNLPIIFHCRDAWPDMIQTISSFNNNISRIASPKSKPYLDEGGHGLPKSDLNNDEGNHDLPSNKYIKEHHDLVKTKYIKQSRFHGVFQCFSGSTERLDLLTTMGYYIGFDGNITYSTDYASLVALTPLNKILLETDSPYLSPIPFRGQRNEPANLPLIAEAIAKYQSLPSPTGVLTKAGLSEISENSTRNAKSLFGI
jgi:Tat protein secretion system quality control protein TatD with DNase activity